MEHCKDVLPIQAKKTEPMSLGEFEFLSACALRFNGWLYEDVAGFDSGAAYHRYVAAHGEYGTLEERMAIFFYLQRYFAKGWLWETDENRTAFRSLFLQVAGSEVLPRYRLHEQGRYELWERDFVRSAGRWKSIVRELLIR